MYWLQIFFELQKLPFCFCRVKIWPKQKTIVNKKYFEKYFIPSYYVKKEIKKKTKLLYAKLEKGYSGPRGPILIGRPGCWADVTPACLAPWVWTSFRSSRSLWVEVVVRAPSMVARSVLVLVVALQTRVGVSLPTSLPAPNFHPLRRWNPEMRTRKPHLSLCDLDLQSTTQPWPSSFDLDLWCPRDQGHIRSSVGRSVSHVALMLFTLTNSLLGKEILFGRAQFLTCTLQIVLPLLLLLFSLRAFQLSCVGLMVSAWTFLVSFSFFPKWFPPTPAACRAK